MNETEQAPTQPETQSEPARETRAGGHRRLWWGLGIGGGLVLLLAVMVLLLPTLLSTGPGQRMVMSYLSSTIAGSLDAERLRLAWFSGQSAMGVTLSDPQGELVASVRRVEAPNVRLLPFLLGSPQYGQVTVDAEAIHVVQQADQPTNLQLALQPAEPRPEEPDEPAEVDEDLSVQLDFTADRVTYEAPDVERVELTNVDVGLEIPDIRRIAARIRSDLVHGDQPGRIDLALNLNDAFDAAGQPQIGQATVEGRGELSNFPLAMADRLMGQEGRLAAMLGEQLDATFTASGPVRALEADVQAQSRHMTVNMQLVGDDTAIRAAEGSQLQLQVTPAAFATWLAEPAPGEAPPMQLDKPFTVTVQLAELMLPRAGETGMDMAHAAVNLQASADDIVLDRRDADQMTLGQPRFDMQSAQLGEEVTMSLQTQATVGEVSEPVSAQLVVRNLFTEDEAQPMSATLEARALPVALADALGQQDGRLAVTLGETLSTTVNLERTAAGDMTFAGQVEAPRLRGPFEGSYGADGAIGLRTPEPMVMLLSPQAFARWAGNEEAPTLELEEAAELSLNIEQLEVAMLEDLQAPAQAEQAQPVEQAPPPAPVDQPADEEPAMRLDPERTRVTASITSPLLRVRNRETQEQFGIEQVQVSARAQDLRQLLQIDVEALIQDLREEFGDPARQPGQDQAPEAGAGAGLREALEQRISQPADQAAERQDDEPDQRISRPADAAGDAGDAGDAAEAGDGERAAAPAPSPLDVPGARGEVRSQTRIEGLLSDTGEMQPAMARIQSETTLNQVPSVVLDALGRQGGNLLAVLGPRTSAEAHVDYRGREGGTADLNLQSDNAAVRVPARITSERELQLRESATATLTVTPAMGNAVLATINPFLNAVSAERPVTVVLHEQGFNVPLEDFDLNRAQLNADLDLGVLRLQQGNMARGLFSALSMVGDRIDPGQTYNAAFSPVTLGFDRGTLSYDDLDMQFSGFTLGFRGDVNYEAKEFNLVMALPSSTLEQLASGLARALGPGQALEVPITGTFDNPQLDSGAMGRQLTQLALRAGLREAVGGDEGDGVGDLLDILQGRSPRQAPAEDDGADEQDTADEEDAAEDLEEEEPEPERRDPVRDIFERLRQRN